MAEHQNAGTPPETQPQGQAQTEAPQVWTGELPTDPTEFSTLVSTIVKEGMHLASDLNPLAILAINAEADKQALTSKALTLEEKLKLSTNVVTNVTELATGNVTATITEEQNLELSKLLEEGKFEDWRLKSNEYELLAKETAVTSTKEALSNLTTEAKANLEEELLKGFNQATGKSITKEVLDLNVPQVLKQPYLEGKETYTQYVTKATQFLAGGITPTAPLGTSIPLGGTGSTPTKEETDALDETELVL